MVVLAHGGPHGALDPALTALRYCLLKLGYALLIPNFSGSSGYGQKFLENALTKVG
jgi:acylaminoacyl-peptidase